MFPRAELSASPEETIETLYLFGEQDRIVDISGCVARPPQARREKPRVSTFTRRTSIRPLVLQPDLVLTASSPTAGRRALPRTIFK